MVGIEILLLSLGIQLLHPFVAGQALLKNNGHVIFSLSLALESIWKLFLCAAILQENGDSEVK